ncbi:MAG: xylan 1,4-beta-xylosidase [Actinomycetota bacterium]|nr:xylan 1,4-beta-xylosidase [Actinomycetota bacterium]
MVAVSNSAHNPAPIHNPVLAGFSPDPSICTVGHDHYLVTSSFEYFPALPLHHSRDLINWRLLGHVIDDPEALPLDGVRCSGGLYAPTIRHHAGRFHVVCTLVADTGPAGHFVVTATDPTGPWSAPAWLDGPGFDPSLLFDGDRAWLTATHEVDPVGAPGRTEIWLREYDAENLCPVGPRIPLWHGALRGARWSEAPHLYAVDGWYYLLTAEGGTEEEHAVVVARSRNVTGPFEGCPANPLLTHRHLGPDVPVIGVGHADLTRTADGRWWAFLLASRPLPGPGAPRTAVLGRETFVVPVEWHDGWPVLAPGAGRVPDLVPGPDLPAHPWPPVEPRDHFDSRELGPLWSFLRTPRERWWDLAARPGHLRLGARPVGPADLGNPSAVLRPQQHHSFVASALLEVGSAGFGEGGEGDEAGLLLMSDDENHVVLALVPEGVGPVTGSRKEEPGRALLLRRRAQGATEELARVPVPNGPLRLGMRACGRRYEALWSSPGGQWQVLGAFDGAFLAPSSHSGFTGTTIGPYARCAPHAEGFVADFDWFEYRPIGEDLPEAP